RAVVAGRGDRELAVAVVEIRAQLAAVGHRDEPGHRAALRHDEVLAARVVEARRRVFSALAADLQPRDLEPRLLREQRDRVLALDEMPARHRELHRRPSYTPLMTYVFLIF